METTETQNTLRDDIAASIDAAETASTPEPSVTTTGTEQPETTTTSTDRARDEKGRFAPKQETAAQPEQAAETPPAQPERLQKPTTWKKEYLSLWDKIEAGEPLTEAERRQHLEYLNQREREYAKGVSTYRTEAEQAKQLFERLNPVIPYLQQTGISPADFVGTLANAHLILSQGSPQQKIQTFQRLAQEYGIHPQMLAGQEGGAAQVINDLQHQLHQSNQQIKEMKAWMERQETRGYESEINQFRNRQDMPFFNDVAQDMSEFLESGIALKRYPDLHPLEAAYKLAVATNPEVQAKEQERIRAEREKAESLERSRNAAVLPKSSSPKGAMATGGGSLRDDLSAMFDAHAGRV